VNHGGFLRAEIELLDKGGLVRRDGCRAVVDAADIHQHELEKIKFAGSGRRLRGLTVAAPARQQKYATSF
jgi:hypothetical protein